MKRFLYILTTLFFITSILFAAPVTVLADEGEGDIKGLEVEVNGYHVTLANQGEWVKGENTVIVTIADEMGMPLTDTEVEILIAPKSAGGHGEAEDDGHAAPEADEHAAPEADTHSPAPESDGHDSMSGMGEATEEAGDHGSSSEEAEAHEEEESSDHIAMREADEHGMYVAEAHLEKSGEHEILVMFHVDGEMLEAAFTVEIPGTNSKTVVLWSFVIINMALIASAGFMKKQTLLVKGTK